MAELKRAHDYEFDPYETPDMQTNPVPEQDPEQQQPKKKAPYEKTERAPMSPARHLKRLSKLERFLLSFVLIAIIGLSILTIQLRTTITQVENEISSIQSQTTEQESKAKELELEKNELSRTDRIKKIAEDNDLAINDDNLRTVK